MALSTNDQKPLDHQDTIGPFTNREKLSSTTRFIPGVEQFIAAVDIDRISTTYPIHFIAEITQPG